MNEKRYISELEVGDLVHDNFGVFQIVKVTKTQYEIVQLDRLGNPMENRSRNRVLRNSGKKVGGGAWVSPLEEPMSEFLAKVDAERQKKEDARKAKEDTWQAKLNLVSEANPDLTPVDEFAGMQKVAFRNKAGTVGMLYFTTSEKEIYNWSSGTAEMGVRIDSVVGYVADTFLSRGYRFSMPSLTTARSLREALVKIIAGSYWE